MKDEIKETLERLQELRNSNYIFSTFDIGLVLDLITNLQEEKEDYKYRCEKASEELKQAYTDIQNNDNANYIHIAFRNDLLNILQNGSEMTNDI